MRFRNTLIVASLAGLLLAAATASTAAEGTAGGPYLGAVDSTIVFDATTMDGPNVYERVAGPLTWVEANAAAASRTHVQCTGSGHLATITSQEEQDAVHALLENDVAFGFLGGRRSTGQWQWVTGEPWGYTNWQPGEPTGGTGEDYLHFGGGGSGSPWIYDGKWNNTYGDWTYPYIVEYENCSGVYDWDFGDGTQTSDAGPTPTHSYSQPGIYDVCVTVTNVAGPSQNCTTAVVYDPSGGFVTGGGWTYSDAGAYGPDPTREGEATFGFVSKYKKGATVPTGNTEFQFKAADLNFHSDSYEWLVVTGGDYARFKGVGTINAEGDYKFQVWAGDGEPDTFRIKIWTEDEATGFETVVYDNGFDQEIGGGSIIVHTKN